MIKTNLNRFLHIDYEKWVVCDTIQRNNKKTKPVSSTLQIVVVKLA